ncbi:MAG: endonuclease III [Bdellovibrionaceae bacterium]|nr:endonuclease III [Pseudobdellovibrionaceae bacterium]
MAANYPEARCALNYRNPWELLVATILSAQCTDERVNLVTPLLFARYPDPLSMAKASLSDVEKIIRSTGFYRSKAKNLIECARSLVTKHGGDVPPRMEELVQLAGVGRKTANVVLGNAFDIASGVVVDTHVTRLSNRLGWVHTRDAVQIERELNTLVPQRHWIMVSHWLIEHGRKICKARSPRCDLCFLSGLCPKVGV